MIVALAAAASISASLAGYFSSEALANYSLSNTSQLAGVSEADFATQIVLRDEALYFQAFSAFYRNETNLGNLYYGMMTEESSQNLVVDEESGAFHFKSEYLNKMYEDADSLEQLAVDKLKLAEAADRYARAFIIMTSSISAAIVVFGEISRVRASAKSTSPPSPIS